MSHFFGDGVGWLRWGQLLFAWKAIDAPQDFSERQGLKRWFTIGRWRVRLSWKIT